MPLSWSVDQRPQLVTAFYRQSQQSMANPELWSGTNTASSFAQASTSMIGPASFQTRHCRLQITD
jgi:hypothetical protein